MDEILTTFEVAKLCGVDITTVINWTESGKLVAYKTPGGHRRIRKDEFIKFLKAFNLPIPRGMGGDGLSALVVDDDDEVREFVMETLKSRWPEMEVFEARDGFGAGKLLAERRPKLVILDLRLPGVDGNEVCASIHADRRLKNTKVLMVTAFTGETDRAHMPDTGEECIIKPFTAKDFLKKVEKLL